VERSGTTWPAPAPRPAEQTEPKGGALMAGMRRCAQGMKLEAVGRALRGQLPDQVLDHATAVESQAGQRS